MRGAWCGRCKKTAKDSKRSKREEVTLLAFPPFSPLLPATTTTTTMTMNVGDASSTHSLFTSSRIVIGCPRKGRSVDLSAVDLLILGYFQFPESADRQITDSVFLCPRTNGRCVGQLIVCPQFPNIISVLLQLSVRRRFIGKNRVNQIHILNVAGESTWNFVPGLRAVDDRPICWSVDRCCRLSICRCVDRFIGGSAIDSSTADRSVTANLEDP